MSSSGELRRLSDGRWLLRRGERRWILPVRVGERFREQGADDTLLQLLDAPAPSGRRRAGGPRPKVVLLPARVVAAAARRLAPWTAWSVLAVAGGGGGFVLASRAWAVPASGASWPGAVAVLFAVLLIHELGHAAALSRGGGRPGAVGMGLMLVVPTFWCDVSEAALVSRVDRVRVDLAGVCWQMGLGAVLSAVGAGASPTIALAVRFIAISAGWSLFPLMRTDGAWALADAVGLRDIEAPLPEGVSPGRRAAAAAVRSCAATALVVVAVFVSLRLIGAVAYMGNETPTAGLITAVVVGVVVPVVLVSGVRRAFGLGLAIRGDIGPLFQTIQGCQAVPTRPRPTTPAQLLPRLVEAITDSEGLLIPLDAMDLACSAGGWTVAQVLEHVCLTADAYIAKIRPALDELGKGDPGLEARPMKASIAGRLLVVGVDPRSVRRLPAPGRFRPSPSPRDDIRNHVFRLYTELYGLLRNGALLPLDRKSFGSPVSPLLRINAWDAFLVLTLHLERHLCQVRRILAR